MAVNNSLMEEDEAGTLAALKARLRDRGQRSPCPRRSCVKDELGASKAAQQLCRHFGLHDFVKGLAAAMQWDDIIRIDLAQGFDRFAHIIFLLRREMEAPNHSVNSLNS